MDKNTKKVKKEDKKTEEALEDNSVKSVVDLTAKKISSKKPTAETDIIPEPTNINEKKNPSDVDIVEPEEINDYYDVVSFNWDETTYNTTISKKFANKKKYEIPNPKQVKAFIPGTIQKVFVSDGSRVKFNDKLLVLEAMKMKNNLLAPFAGVIKKVYVKQGAQVSKNEILVEFK